MSFITTDEVRAHISTALSDDALQLLIDAEESNLARRIGTLDIEYAEMVETFDPRAADFLVLTRPTDSVEVVDNEVTVDVVLRSDGRTVVPDSGSWTGPVVVTYTPNDEYEVKKVLIELLRLATTETAYTSENSDSYGYENDAGIRARKREGLIRSLLPKQLPNSVRIVSSVTP